MSLNSTKEQTKEMYEKLNNLQRRINKLCPTPIANSKKQLDSWSENPELFFLSKMKLINQAPEDLIDDINEVSSYFQTKMLDYSNRKKYSNKLALRKKFEEILYTIEKKENWTEDTPQYFETLKYVSSISNYVRNIGDVEFFACMLPAIDPQDEKKYKEIGELMSIFFFLEYVWKNLKQLKPGIDPYEYNSGLKKVVALYKISIDSKKELSC